MAARVLRRGGVIAHPTEGVWGLACLPHFEAAVEKIIELKQRDRDKGLILVGGAEAHFSGLFDSLDDAALQRLRASWPGPVSWIVPDTGWAPPLVRGAHGSVAVRVTDHPLTSMLCQLLDSPLVSTSANPAGKPAATDEMAARHYFGSCVDFYLSGALGGRSGPSELRDAISGHRYR